MEGADVKELQTYLIQLGYDCGAWGADGDFGDTTEIAVCKFQEDAGIDIDGEVGPQTIKALEEALEDKVVESPRIVKIVNGNCYVRVNPDKTSKSLGVVHRNDTYLYAYETSETGWQKINFRNSTGWVSGKYSELIK